MVTTHPPRSVLRWSRSSSQPVDQPQDLLEQFLRHGDLGHLEYGVAGVAHDLGPDLHQLLPQAGQRPLRDRSFRAIMASGRVKPLALPARSPNLNAYAERWVRSVKEECLSKVILFGERSLRQARINYVDHFHAERNHQGKGNILLFPRNTDRGREGPVRCRERLGGLLRCYHREAA